MVAVRRKRYQVDLAAEQAECEINYRRLTRLISAAARDHHSFDIGGDLHMHVRAVERNPYTTTFEITQASAHAQPIAIPIIALAQKLTVRAYHDARLAEVVAFAPWRRAYPRYEYPNAAMHQPDEKSQWNRFLGEWLSHCLQHGYPRESNHALSLSGYEGDVAAGAARHGGPF